MEIHETGLSSFDEKKKEFHLFLFLSNALSGKVNREKDAEVKQQPVAE